MNFNLKIFAGISTLFLILNGVDALKCYHCSFGLPMDLRRFPQLFNQNIYPGGQVPNRQQKWCAMTQPPKNSSTLQECAGGCALARSTDNLSRWAGCAASPVPVDSSYSVVHINNSHFEMFVCNRDRCNASPEIASKSTPTRKGKAKSSASGIGLSSTLLMSSVLLVFKWF